MEEIKDLTILEKERAALKEIKQKREKAVECYNKTRLFMKRKKLEEEIHSYDELIRDKLSKYCIIANEFKYRYDYDNGNKINLISYCYSPVHDEFFSRYLYLVVENYDSMNRAVFSPANQNGMYSLDYSDFLRSEFKLDNYRYLGECAHIKGEEELKIRNRKLEDVEFFLKTCTEHIMKHKKPATPEEFMKEFCEYIESFGASKPEINDKLEQSSSKEFANL